MGGEWVQNPKVPLLCTQNSLSLPTKAISSTSWPLQVNSGLVANSRFIHNWQGVLGDVSWLVCLLSSLNFLSKYPLPSLLKILHRIQTRLKIHPKLCIQQNYLQPSLSPNCPKQPKAGICCWTHPLYLYLPRLHHLSW